ncbi:phytanoyl-CoA dioxygenase family protein [Undibacterium sp. MH2W]|uniref:phytanoyl-CoA dioxygenase family protein n=1 Tax=Undibacterium sp. MH2W TaxID=3413044 RepID=UPI003BEF5DF1
MLTQEQISQFHEDGYVLIPDFKTAAEIAALRERAEQIVNDFDPASSKSIFTTKEQEQHIDHYFLNSATNMSCFFEEEAFDADGKLKQDKSLSINKIGHAMHDLDPVFSAFSRGPGLAQVAKQLGLQRPQIWQSMYIFKQPGIGGEVRWHQDATYFETDPVSVTTFWFALEDATLENGCLWAEPGGHKTPMRERFVRHGDVVTVEKLSDMPWPSDATAVPLEVKAGTLVCFHGLLPHYSAPNRSPISRHAYTLHVTDGATTYSPQNWIQRDERFPVRGFE